MNLTATVDGKAIVDALSRAFAVAALDTGEMSVSYFISADAGKLVVSSIGLEVSTRAVIADSKAKGDARIMLEREVVTSMLKGKGEVTIDATPTLLKVKSKGFNAELPVGTVTQAQDRVLTSKAEIKGWQPMDNKAYAVFREALLSVDIEDPLAQRPPVVHVRITNSTIVTVNASKWAAATYSNKFPAKTEMLFSLPGKQFAKIDKFIGKDEIKRVCVSGSRLIVEGPTLRVDIASVQDNTESAFDLIRTMETSLGKPALVVQIDNDLKSSLDAVKVVASDIKAPTIKMLHHPGKGVELLFSSDGYKAATKLKYAAKGTLAEVVFDLRLLREALDTISAIADKYTLSLYGNDRGAKAFSISTANCLVYGHVHQ